MIRNRVLPPVLALLAAALIAWPAVWQVAVPADAAASTDGDVPSDAPLADRVADAEARLARLDRVLASHPGSDDHHVDRGELLLRLAGLRQSAAWTSLPSDDPARSAEDFLARAEDDFRRALALAPTDPRPYLGLAVIGLARSEAAFGRVHEEDRLVELAVSLAPSSPPVLRRAGRYYLDRGFFEPALRQFSAAVAVNPAYADSIHRALSRRRILPSMLGPEVPGSAAFWVLMGRAWRRAGEIREATAAFELAVDLDGASADAFRDLTDLYWSQARRAPLARALVHYEGTAGEEAAEAELHLQRARIAYLDGDVLRAAAEAREVLSGSPASLRLEDHAAWLLWKSGASTEAVAAWSALLGRKKDNTLTGSAAGAIHRKIGVVLEEQRSYVEALRHFRLALRQDPGDEAAAEGVRRLTGKPGSR